MQITANSVRLLSGGNVIKQGDQTPLAFQLFDEKGEIVDLQNATVKVKIANSSVVVLEKIATVDINNVVSFSLLSDDLIGYGKMRMEFSVTYSDLIVEKFPANGWQEITITPSLDDISIGEVSVITVEQFEQRVDAAVNEAESATIVANEAANRAEQFANVNGDMLEITTIAPKESFKTVELVSGQDDETPIVTNSTLSVDDVNFKVGNRAWKITTSGATTATAKVSNDLLKHPPASAIGAWVYVDDPGLITQITIEIRLPSTATWTRTESNLVQGWNLIRFPSSAGASESILINEWGKGATWVRFIAVTTGATSFTIGRVWAECPPKAQILFIEDGGYTTFLNTGYQDLKARNIPVTWSLDPAKLGTSLGTKAERITETDVMELGKENNNSMNFHGYTGDPTATMTKEQIRSDVVKSLKWLDQRGFTEGYSWRSAWVQNSATNADAARSLLMAYATPNSSAALTNFPPTDRWNIPRLALHGMSQSALDSYFNILRVTNQLMVVYTHGIHVDGTTGGADTTPSEWEYFISKIDQGISEGWLEGVTLETLMKRAKVEIKPNSGDWVTDLYHEQPIDTLATKTELESVNDSLVSHLADGVSHVTQADKDKWNASDTAKFKKGSSTYTDNDTSQTFTDTFCTVDSLVTIVITSATAPKGVWSVESAAGTFTITSTAAEDNDITFDYFIQKAVG